MSEKHGFIFFPDKKQVFDERIQLPTIVQLKNIIWIKVLKHYSISLFPLFPILLSQKLSEKIDAFEKAEMTKIKN